jgi:hypothetical protein
LSISPSANHGSVVHSHSESPVRLSPRTKRDLLTHYHLGRGKTRLAKWYAPYNVSFLLVGQSHGYGHMLIKGWIQDEEKVKLKGEVSRPITIDPQTRAILKTNISGPPSHCPSRSEVPVKFCRVQTAYADRVPTIRGSLLLRLRGCER